MHLGFLTKDAATKRFELTSKTLEFGYRYSKSNNLVRRAAPYLLHLSQETDETVSLTVLDDTNIVFISRFQSRHVLNTDVVVGTSLPAFCTSPGIAILSKLPDAEVKSILTRSELRPITPHTTWKKDDLLAKIKWAQSTGYAVAWNEYYIGDLSVAAPINGPHGRPLGAVSIAVSASRYSPEEAESKFAGLAVATARALT
jgi:DNA-binding IclR family transcriptional regulator